MPRPRTITSQRKKIVRLVEQLRDDERSEQIVKGIHKVYADLVSQLWQKFMKPDELGEQSVDCIRITSELGRYIEKQQTNGSSNVAIAVALMSITRGMMQYLVDQDASNKQWIQVMSKQIDTLFN